MRWSMSRGRRDRYISGGRRGYRNSLQVGFRPGALDLVAPLPFRRSPRPPAFQRDPVLAVLRQRRRLSVSGQAERITGGSRRIIIPVAALLRRPDRGRAL